MCKRTMALFLILTTGLSFAQTTGLKKVNYQDETSDKKAEGSDSAALSAEEAKKMTDNIDLIKKKQAESQKALDDMDEDE